MPAWAEVLADRPEGGEKALGMARGLEAPHRSLTLACRLMRVFCPVVQALMLAMLDTRHDFLPGGLVAAEFVRDQHAWNVRAALEQFAEEFRRRCLVASALNQDIQYVAVLIDCPPQVLRLAIDFQEHFIEEPLVAWPSPSASELVGVRLAEFARPLAYCFVGDDDAALSQEFLHIAITEAKAEVEPNRVRDNFLGITKAFVWQRRSCLHLPSIA